MGAVSYTLDDIERNLDYRLASDLIQIRGSAGQAGVHRPIKSAASAQRMQRAEARARDIEAKTRQFVEDMQF